MRIGVTVGALCCLWPEGDTRDPQRASLGKRRKAFPIGTVTGRARDLHVTALENEARRGVIDGAE